MAEDIVDFDNIKFGYWKSTPDYRDYKYEEKLLFKLVTLPPSVDLRHLIKRVKNQGGLGSCVSHGTTSAFEALQVKRDGSDVAGSRLQVYENGRIIGGYYTGKGNDDTGMECRDGVKATVKYGVAPEDVWQYIESKFDDPIPDNVASEALKYTSTNYYLLDSANGHTGTFDNIKNALATAGLPVIFGTPVYGGIKTVGADGMIPMPNGKPLGGHCMLIVGYDDEKQCLLILNSWGTGWGMNGFGWLPYAYVLRGLVSDCWVIAAESEINPPITPPPEASSSDVLLKLIDCLKAIWKDLNEDKNE